ncbi:MAG: HisA/HisF-related TIM barrel protein [Candidatus Thorarchaeota archaeon]|jgi:phosphoribosylformimino-5-aminoimidazole carboxamide ribotide isomerase
MGQARIIPVMDIMRGHVVHGIAGQRNKYRPISSSLVDGANPLDVASAFQKHFGVEEIYIADLDAIMRRGNNLKHTQDVLENLHLTVLLDGGVSSKKDVEKFADAGIPKVVVATETIESLETLKEITDAAGEKVIGSLDLKNGKTLSSSADFRNKDPLRVAHIFEEYEIKELIVLELSLVGSGRGPIHDSLKVVSENTDLRVIAGGGVRNREDLQSLHSIGVEAALIATALHKGGIAP